MILLIEEKFNKLCELKKISQLFDQIKLGQVINLKPGKIWNKISILSIFNLKINDIYIFYLFLYYKIINMK